MNKVMYLSVATIVGVLLAYVLFFGIDFQNVKPGDLSKIVLEGSIDITDDKVESIGLWSRGGEAKGIKFEKVEFGATVVVDIVNCSGYIATATAFFNENQAWEVKLLPETIAADAVEKVRVCSSQPESKYVSSNAFAIAPVVEKRRQMKTKILGKPTIYGLPVNIQIWADKNGIDNWADTDGNEDVDLISVNGFCNASEDYTCSRIMIWNGISWIEIAYTTPA